MGIDVYLLWDGQTQEEKEAQFTGYALGFGHVGHLREAYGGGVYALPDLFREDFLAVEEGAAKRDEEDDRLGSRIPAATLRERLPAALEATAQRYEGAQEIISEAQKSISDFVALAEKLEAEGKNPRCLVSA